MPQQIIPLEDLPALNQPQRSFSLSDATQTIPIVPLSQLPSISPARKEQAKAFEIYPERERDIFKKSKFLPFRIPQTIAEEVVRGGRSLKKAFTDEDASFWSRGLHGVIGALEIGFAPLTGLVRPLIGEPAEALLRAAGTSERAAEIGGLVAEVGGFVGMPRLMIKLGRVIAAKSKIAAHKYFLGFGPPEGELAKKGMDEVLKATTEINVSNAQTKFFTAALRKEIPPDMRKEMLYYTQKTANPNIPNDTFQKLSKRLSPKARKIADTVARERLDRIFTQQTKHGMLTDINYIENYITQIYAGKHAQEMAVLLRKKFLVKSPFKGRQLPTYFDAKMRHGLDPAGDFADVLETYEIITNKVIAQTQMMKNLGKLKVNVVDIAAGVNVQGKAIPGIMRIDKARKAGIPTGGVNDFTPKDGKWAYIDVPALRRAMPIETTKKGAVILSKVGVAVHPDIAYGMRLMFQQTNTSKYIKGVELINAFAKAAELSFSFFHPFALAESGFAVGRGLLAFNPVSSWRKGLKLIEKDLGHVTDMARANVDLGHTAALDIGTTQVTKGLKRLEETIGNVPGLRHIPGYSSSSKAIVRITRQAKELQDRGLWDIMHRGLKSYWFNKVYAKALKEFPEMDNKQILETVGSYINDAFGGQSWGTMFAISPKMQQFARIGMLAPDWTLSQIKVAGKALVGKNPLALKLHRRYMLRMMTGYAAFHNILNYASTKFSTGEGKNMWENDAGHEFEVQLPWTRKDDKGNERKLYIHAGKQLREVFRWFSSPLEQAGNKLSPIAREIFTQVTSHAPGSGFPAPFAEKTGGEAIVSRAVSVISKFKPFSLSESQFALTIPLRKGTGMWRAVRDTETALKKELGGIPWWDYEATSPSVIKILAGAKNNGLDPMKVLTAAKQRITKGYYSDYWNALEEEDFSAVNKAADRISKLDLVTERGLRSALSYRNVDKAHIDKAIEDFLQKGRKFATRKELLKRFEIKPKKTKKFKPFPVF